MSNNNFTKILHYNYLVEPWKEGDRLISKIYRKKELKVNNNIFLGAYIGKNSRLTYKMHYLSVIITKYIYSIKKHIKVYKYIVFNVKKLLTNNFFKKNKKLAMNKLVFKKKFNAKNAFNKFNKIGKFYNRRKMNSNDQFKKKLIVVFKTNLFIYYKKWLKKKFKIERKKLWTAFYKTSANFWGNKYKKQIKRFLFNLLDKKHNLSNYYLLNYEQIIYKMYCYLNKKKLLKLNDKKNRKKNILNLSDHIMTNNMILFDNKNNINNLFFFGINNSNLLANSIILNYDFVNDSLGMYNNLNLFVINLNYYTYLVNLKNSEVAGGVNALYTNNKKNKFFYKNIICYFYECLYYIYSNKKYLSSNYIIRTGLVRQKNLFCNLHIARYYNVYIKLINDFSVNYFNKSRYIVNKLNEKIYNHLIFIKSISSCLFNGENVHFKLIENSNFIQKNKKINKSVFLCKLFDSNKFKKFKGKRLYNNFFYNKKLLGRNFRKHLYNRFNYFFYPYQTKKIKNKSNKKYFFFKKKITDIYKGIESSNNIFKQMLVSLEKGTALNFKKKTIYFRKFNENKKIALSTYKKLHFLKKYKKILRKRLYYKMYIFKRKKNYNNYRKFIKKNNNYSGYTNYRKINNQKSGNNLFNNIAKSKKFKFIDFFKKKPVKFKSKLKLTNMYYKKYYFRYFLKQNKKFFYIVRTKKKKKKNKLFRFKFGSVNYLFSKYKKKININFNNGNNIGLYKKSKKLKFINVLKKQLSNKKSRFFNSTKLNVLYNKKIKKNKIYLLKRNKYFKKYYWVVYKMSYIYKELLMFYVFKLKTFLINKDRFFLNKKYKKNNFFNFYNEKNILNNILLYDNNNNNNCNIIFNDYSRWVSFELSKYYFMNKVCLLNNSNGYYYKNLFFRK